MSLFLLGLSPALLLVAIALGARLSDAARQAQFARLLDLGVIGVAVAVAFGFGMCFSGACAP